MGEGRGALEAARALERARVRAARAQTRLPPPTTRWYQCHASGLIGSPTVPSSRSDARLCFVTYASPFAHSARMAVGAV